MLVDAAIATSIEDRKPVGGSTVFDTYDVYGLYAIEAVAKGGASAGA